MRPAIPDTGEWMSQATLKSKKRYSGRILEARAADRDLPPETRAWSPAFAREVLEGATLWARVVAPAPTDDQMHVLQLADVRRREIAGLMHHGTSVEFSARLNAARARFPSPAVRLDGVFPERAGDTVEVWGAYRDGALMVGTGSGPSTGRTAVLRLSPHLAWSFVWSPKDALGREELPITVIWIVGLAVPLGYFIARGRRGRHHISLGIALALPPLAFLVLPLVFQIAQVRGADVAALLLGLAAGWGAALAFEHVGLRARLEPKPRRDALEPSRSAA
jgi:hypothetical protein